MKRYIFNLLVLIISFNSFTQQGNTSVMYDNYINCFYGVQNPSTLVDSRSKMSFYTGFNYASASNFYAPDYPLFEDMDFGGKIYENRKSGYQKRSSDYDVFGAKIDYNSKNSFGYVYRFRTFTNYTGITETWNENAAYNYQNNNAVGIPINIEGFSYANMRFTEHALSYGRVIFDRETKALKAGISMKFLNGLNARYLYADKGSMTFLDPDNDEVKVNDAEFSFGRENNNDQEKYKNRGLGFDIGITYEYRPDFEKQYYDMDGEEGIVRNDINKYKLKLFASITDIGYVNYMKDTNTYNFSLDNSLLDVNQIYNVDFDFQGPTSFIKNNVLNQPFSAPLPKQESKFKMNLPTTLHLGADYNIKNNWYASYNMSIPMNLFKDPTRVSYSFITTLTPRFEKPLYSVMTPLSIVGNGKAYVGLAGRLMLWGYSVYLGSNNIMYMFGQKASLTRSVYFGVSYNILYKTPKDRDFDKVSDFKDQCPDDKGPWSLLGCPDTDKDGILDKDDYCVYDAGSIKTRGCPDTDSDGIIDLNDRCPNEKGLGVHLGCPDRDFDGVIDVADKCPDVPGIELNNGCPIENPGCCLDNDGDGVTNAKDKCPDFAGSVYNEGCPIDKENIDKINLNDKKEDKDPNHTDNQMSQNVQSNGNGNQNVQTENDQVINSSQELQSVFADKNVVKTLTLYFNVDQSNIDKEEQKRFNEFMDGIKDKKDVSFVILGHTDRDGSLDYNLILSMKRAETVKRKISDRGYKKDLIEVYYFGESKALYKDDYSAEQKQMSRKVEINVVKKNK
jgi:outer membrane protein OmpA-like peptidoglycan-associated protein